MTTTQKTRPIDVIAEPVISALREAIERGDNGDWIPPWRGVNAGMPLRECGKPYQGINVFLLALAASMKGYGSPYWFTFKAAKRHNWKVRKGEKSTPICFYKSYVATDKETGEKEQRRVLRYYRVFNAEQIDGIDCKYLPAPVEYPNAVTDTLALDVIKACGVPVELGGNAAFYRPSADSITLPDVERFESNAGFAGTALHELAHATGHKSRLDRNLTGRFGDYAYATEELIAEFAATVLCAAFGFEYRLERHASYLEHWYRAIKNNPSVLTAAGAAAQTAADYVLQFNQERIAA